MLKVSNFAANNFSLPDARIRFKGHPITFLPSLEDRTPDKKTLTALDCFLKKCLEEG